MIFWNDRNVIYKNSNTYAIYQSNTQNYCLDFAIVKFSVQTTLKNKAILKIINLVTSQKQILSHWQGVLFSITYDAVRRCLYSTSDDRTVRVWHVEMTTVGSWDSATVYLKQTLYGHSARVWRCITVSDVLISIGEVGWKYFPVIFLYRSSHETLFICLCAFSRIQMSVSGMDHLENWLNAGSVMVGDKFGVWTVIPTRNTLWVLSSCSQNQIGSERTKLRFTYH